MRKVNFDEIIENKIEFYGFGVVEDAKFNISATVWLKDLNFDLFFDEPFVLSLFDSVSFVLFFDLAFDLSLIITSCLSLYFSFLLSLDFSEDFLFNLSFDFTFESSFTLFLFSPFDSSFIITFAWVSATFFLLSLDFLLFFFEISLVFFSSATLISSVLLGCVVLLISLTISVFASFKQLCPIGLSVNGFSVMSSFMSST